MHMNQYTSRRARQPRAHISSSLQGVTLDDIREGVTGTRNTEQVVMVRTSSRGRRAVLRGCTHHSMQATAHLPASPPAKPPAPPHPAPPGHQLAATGARHHHVPRRRQVRAVLPRRGRQGAEDQGAGAGGGHGVPKHPQGRQLGCALHPFPGEKHMLCCLRTSPHGNKHTPC